jgi:hypothetical protein
MNTIAGEFDSVYADDDLVEEKTPPKVLAATPISAPMEAKPLRGYDIAMREHAAACEAGR